MHLLRQRLVALRGIALQQVEQLQPGLETGLIVTAAVGNVIKTDTDFVSLNSARATASLVGQARAAGKKVHVWTVNRPEVMLRMIERNVDNVITDDPAALVRVMHERSGLTPQEQAEAVLARIKPTVDYAQLEGADLVIEAVFEHRGIKADVTAKAEAVMPRTSVFASNTSTLPITGLAKASKLSLIHI